MKKTNKKNAMTKKDLLCAACEAAVKAHALSAKLLMDVINEDPFGAGTQYPPHVIAKAEAFHYAVAYTVDEEGAEWDVIGTASDMLRGKINEASAKKIELNFDEMVRSAFVSIEREARNAVAYLGKMADNDVLEAFEGLIREMQSCDDNYFQTGYKGVIKK